MNTCFRITFTFSPDLDTEARNALLDQFILHAIEANGLQFGGGGSRNVWDGSAESGSEATREVSEAQRMSVIAWLEGEPLVLDRFVGDLCEDKLVDDLLLEKLERLVGTVEMGAPREEIERLLDEFDG